LFTAVAVLPTDLVNCDGLGWPAPSGLGAARARPPFGGMSGRRSSQNVELHFECANASCVVEVVILCQHRKITCSRFGAAIRMTCGLPK
jgi:hypothetical protein